MSDGCRHGNGPPSQCSQCVGAVARRVINAGPELLIDGQPAGRLVNTADETARIKYGKRGKAQSMRVTRSKRT